MATNDTDYLTQTWHNGDLTTPIDETRLTHIEAGIKHHNHPALTDADAEAGSHDGLFWDHTSGDTNQVLRVRLGDDAEVEWDLNPDGSLATPAGFKLWPVIGVPSGAIGSRFDWAISKNGILYFKDYDGSATPTLAWQVAAGGGVSVGGTTWTFNTNGSLTTPAGWSLWPLTGVPSDSFGTLGDWAISANGKIYHRQYTEGATPVLEWAEAGGGVSLDVGTAPAVHTYVSGDIADPASWYGEAPVVFFTWTPTKSGSVVLQPPAFGSEVDGGADLERDYLVFQGNVANVDYPDRTAASGSFPGDAITDSYWQKPTISPLTVRPQKTAHHYPIPAVLTVTAGQVYTIAIVDWDDVAVAGHNASYLEFYQSVQQLGGVSPLVPPIQGTPLIVSDGDLATSTTGPREDITAVAEFGARAVGDFSHAEGFSTLAIGNDSHSEGGSTAAVGNFSHAEGASTVATGQASHAEGNGTTATASMSHAEGFGSESILPCMHAWAGGQLFNTFTSTTALAEGIRVVTQPLETTNGAIQTLVDPLGATLQLAAHDGCWGIQGFVVARRIDSVGAVSYWRFDALLEGHAAASPFLRLIGSSVTMVYQDAAASAWTVTVDTHSGVDFRIRVKGETAKTIHWVCSFEGGLVQ